MSDNLDNKDELVSEEDILDNESDTNSEEHTEVKSTNTNNSNNNNEFREKMIKMFGFVIIALIVVLVVGFLISLVLKKNYSYATVEEELKNAAINYFKDNKNKLPKNASEIVEIFEEKLDELNVTLPGIAKNKDEQSARIKSKTRNELISDIEDFIYMNKRALNKKVA